MGSKSPYSVRDQSDRLYADHSRMCCFLRSNWELHASQTHPKGPRKSPSTCTVRCTQTQKPKPPDSSAHKFTRLMIATCVLLNILLCIQINIFNSFAFYSVNRWKYARCEHHAFSFFTTLTLTIRVHESIEPWRLCPLQKRTLQRLS